MKHNFIFKAAILIALLVFLAGTPYKVYADVQENIITTEDGYADNRMTMFRERQTQMKLTTWKPRRK